MTNPTMIGVSAIPVLGIGAQWLAWRWKLPSILLLLALGLLVGPATGFLIPDKLLGELLFPVVSLSVALILFEGGMCLRFHELHEIGGVVGSLLTVGPVIAFVGSTAAAHYVGGMPLGVAALVGAILVVTGPTVIMPLLRTIRTKGNLAPIIRWEGIVNDPTGAVLAVLIFEFLLERQLYAAAGGTHAGLTAVIVTGALKTLVLGVVLGAGLARFMVLCMARNWCPDFLHASVTAMLVVLGFGVSNVIQEESGLLTVTVMGIVMANQRQASVRHVLEFLENLRVVLISALFIVLSARLTVADLKMIDGKMLAFLAALIFVVRPATIFIATIGSKLTTAEKLFLSWMAPRGIVAASVASVFAIRLGEAGMPGADRIVPAIFLVIVGTVVLYGFTAKAVASRLGLLEQNPQGALILGSHRLARAIGHALKARGFRVRLIDTNWQQIKQARIEGLPVTFGDAFSAKVFHNLNLDGIGRLLAVTPNDRVNALACIAYQEYFGRAGLFQLAPEKASAEGYHEHEKPIDLHGRYLFGDQWTYAELDSMLAKKGEIKFTKITKEFTLAAFRKRYGRAAAPLFLVTEKGQLEVFVEGHEAKSTGTLISLISAASLQYAADADAREAESKAARLEAELQAAKEKAAKRAAEAAAAAAQSAAGEDALEAEKAKAEEGRASDSGAESGGGGDEAETDGVESETEPDPEGPEADAGDADSDGSEADTEDADSDLDAPDGNAAVDPEASAKPEKEAGSP